MMGSVGLGVWYKENLQSRQAEILKIIRWEELLEGELLYKRSFLAECCRNTAEYTTGNLREMLETIWVEWEKSGDFKDTFCRCAKTYLKKTNLGKNEKKIFLQLFMDKSYSDIDLQISQIENNKKIMMGIYNENMPVVKEKCRLAVTVGGIAGVMLVILLF